MLQGVILPERVPLSAPLPAPISRPTEQPEAGHELLQFSIPENVEGSAPKRKYRKKQPTAASETATTTTVHGTADPLQPGQAPQGPQPPRPWYGYGWNPQFMWPPVPYPMGWNPLGYPHPVPPQMMQQQAPPPSPTPHNIGPTLRPRKKKAQTDSTYQCSQCKQRKSKETGHRQYKHKWYCPSINLSFENWKATQE